ncbi:MAG: SDR family oxidoreductase [Candidatus Lokiarchaeota archaeon]|nr:SDR family oxidoreductase [Candidatus Lokiarchaeota archaeon]
MLLKGKNIVITGSGRGIGRAVALACAKEGANIGLTSRTLEQLNNVKKEIEDLDTDVNVVVKNTDITNYAEVEKSFKVFHDELGLLNGVIANAGRSWRANAHEAPPDKFFDVINTNITGVFYTFRAAYPYLKKDDKENKARFLITGSAVYPSVMGGFSSYTASKYGVVGLQRELATEYKRENIVVNMVLPMQVDTKMLRGRSAGDGNKAPGVLDPEDLNDYYLFLLSDRANRVNDMLIYPNTFEALKLIIKKAPKEKIENWDTFKIFLEEVSQNMYNEVKKYGKLGEFILNRSR